MSPAALQIRGEARRRAGGFSTSMRWEIGITGGLPCERPRPGDRAGLDDVAVIDQSDIANWLVNRPEQFNKVPAEAARENHQVDAEVRVLEARLPD